MVVTVIPVVILITIWWAWMVDYTIDRVSMFALIFSIGILVDDATVVVENIFRHWLIKGRTTIAEFAAFNLIGGCCCTKHEAFGKILTGESE